MKERDGGREGGRGRKGGRERDGGRERERWREGGREEGRERDRERDHDSLLSILSGKTLYDYSLQDTYMQWLIYTTLYVTVCSLTVLRCIKRRNMHFWTIILLAHLYDTIMSCRLRNIVSRLIIQ